VLALETGSWKSFTIETLQVHDVIFLLKDMNAVACPRGINLVQYSLVSGQTAVSGSLQLSQRQHSTSALIHHGE